MSRQAAHLRSASPADASAIAEVYIESWRSSYRGLIPEPVLDGMNALKQTSDWWGVLCRSEPGRGAVAAVDDAGRVFGFASFGPARQGQAGDCGEVYTLYLLAARQGRGSGRRLLAAAARRLRAAGFRSLAVWALADNPACAFYEHLGGVAGERRPITNGGTGLHEVCYLWPELGPLTGHLLAAEEAP
jgi:GNAT superfamily N-acetyltransferase